jgi:hypothetical protein
VLGLAFLYIVASQQGVLGPQGRTLTGAAASLGLIGAGLALERRGEGLIGAIAAVGAGIAGIYLALVAATRIFDLIPAWAGMGLAAAVAAFAVVVARRWRSQVVAAFGLCGALAAPVLVDAGITPATIAFVLIIAAAVSWLWLTMRWTVLAIAGGVLSGVYVLALVIAAAVIDRDETGLGWNDFWQSVLGTGLFWALLAGVALAHHRLRGQEDRGALAKTLQLTVGAGALAVFGASAMFADAGAGWALLAIAAAYAALTLAPPALGRPSQVLRATLALIAVAAVFLAMVDLLGGGTRAAIIALQGGGLALVAERVRDIRVQWAAAAYLLAAALLTVSEASPPRDLFIFPPESLTNAAGTAMDGGAVAGAIAAALALALGTAALAWSSERLASGPSIQGTARPAALAAIAAILYAVTTVIVNIGLLASFTRDSFRASHAMVSIVWGIGALTILVLGLRRRARVMRTAGLALLGVTLAKLLLFDLSQLNALSRAVAFVVVGALFVAGSIAYQRLSSEQEAEDD